MTTAAAMPQPRSLPRFGGFTLGMIKLELRRMLRNRRTVIFTLVMPAVFFLLFGTNGDYRAPSPSATAATSPATSWSAWPCTARCWPPPAAARWSSIERAAGWSRQLRLTPLKPVAYIAVKLVLAMIIGAVSVAVTVRRRAPWPARSCPLTPWIECGLLAWVCALVFAAFGLFMGYLLPSENVMQILGPVLAVLSFAGGLFVPVDQLGHTFATIAKFTPVYGVGELARYPLTHDGNLWLAVLNVVVWTAIFAAGAMWRFRRDTARV